MELEKQVAEFLNITVELAKQATIRIDNVASLLKTSAKPLFSDIVKSIKINPSASLRR